MIEAIIGLEWESFQEVHHIDGRADCQDDYETFRIMRASQFTTWPLYIQQSYLKDIQDARAARRNLIFEKYGWMMASNDPDGFSKICHSLPKLSSLKLELTETIIALQIPWKIAFNQTYPGLGEQSRLVYSREDTFENTSFETYLRGELYTYSETTLKYYLDYILSLEHDHRNIVEMTMIETVRHYGYPSLAAAQNAL